MKAKALQQMLDNITVSYPDSDLKIEGKEMIFSSDKENGDVEWSHKKVKSIAIEFDSEPTTIVIKLWTD